MEQVNGVFALVFLVIVRNYYWLLILFISTNCLVDDGIGGISGEKNPIHLVAK